MGEPATELLLGLPQLEVTWLAKDHWWGDAMRMARQHGITIYDASYIAVAKTSNAVLCSLDRDQLNVAKKEGLAPLSV